MAESQTTPFLRVDTRRSQRVMARVRVRVIRRGEADPDLSEDTHTSVVNAHGGLLALAMNVKLGELLVLRNLAAPDEQPVRVVRVGEKQASKREVAIEFTKPAPRFWHIDFPPADWKLLPD
jgi:hypothetical protein